VLWCSRVLLACVIIQSRIGKEEEGFDERVSEGSRGGAKMGVKAPAGARSAMRPQERQTIPVGNVSGGERREWVRIYGVSAKHRHECRRGKHECLRHIPRIQNQQLSGCVLESGDAAASSARATSCPESGADFRGCLHRFGCLLYFVDRD
jgi:hypothetical protein